MTVRVLIAVVLAAAAGAGRAPGQATSFTAGNLVVYQVGDGSAALAGTGNVVVLKEFTTGGSSSGLYTVTLPSTGTGSKLIASGTSTTEGMFTLGNTGQTLALAGYDTTTGGSTSLTTTSVNRSIALVTATGTASLTSLSDFAGSSNTPRAAYTTDGNRIYVTGSAGGVRTTTAGSSTSTQLSTTETNLRGAGVYGGQLFVSTAAGTTIRVGSVGTGTPTTSGQTITNLPGFPTSSGSSNQFVLFRVGNPTSFAGPNVLYVSDDSSGGSIQKYTFDGSTWTAQGSVAAASIRGLTAQVTGDNQVTLFGATGPNIAAGGGTLYSYTDGTGTGAISGTPTASSIATAGTNTAFRGVAFAPARLAWNGGSGSWDLTSTASWTNTAATGTPTSKFFNAYAANFGTIAANATVTVNPGINPAAVNVTNAANTYTFTNGTTGSAGIQGLAALNKSGAGTLVLASPNTYTGGTFVTAGMLVAGNTALAGSATGGGSVVVSGTGTLAGTGTVAPLTGANVTIQSGGTLYPGATAGTAEATPLTIGDGSTNATVTVQFQSGGKLAVDLAASGSSDSLSVVGTATKLNFVTGSVLSLRAAGFSPTAPASYTLATLPAGLGNNIQVDAAATANNQVLGTFTQGGAATGPVMIDASAFALSGGNTFQLVRSGDAVVLNYTLAPVPEPATVLGAAAAALGLAEFVRRLRSRARCAGPQP